MMPDAGLRTDQAPPLAIPASFFLTTPVAMVAGGILLIVHPEALLARWSGAALALVHVGTLGVLGATMLGALYQLTPVVAGAPVPAVRLAHAVHAAFVVGVTGLVAGFLGAPSWSATLGLTSLALAFLLFLGPLAVALRRAPALGWTPTGMRLAVTALALTVAVGVRIAFGHAGGAFPAARLVWTQVHLSLGLVTWVGGLVAAASWQLVPMFYLAPAFDPRRQRLVHGLQALSMVALVAVLGATEVGLPVTPAHAALAAVPGALGVWWLAPGMALHGLRHRARPRADGSIRSWFLAIAAAWALPVLGAAAVLVEDPRWGVAFAWMVLWGWAATLVHGMLTRILPFLVWFHRCAPRLGKAPVPPMRALYPDRRVQIGAGLHALTTVAGLVGIALGRGSVAGPGLIATGAWLGWHLIGALRHRG